MMMFIVMMLKMDDGNDDDFDNDYVDNDVDNNNNLYNNGEIDCDDVDIGLR